jgi:hypothetical protein
MPPDFVFTLQLIIYDKKIIYDKYICYLCRDLIFKYNND